MIFWLTTIVAARSIRAERFLFEAYDGERPREAEAIMQVLRQGLQATELEANPTILTQRLHSHVYSNGIADAEYKPEVFEKDVTAGMDAWSNADFDIATQRLTTAIARARANPLMLVREPRCRATMMRALLRTALASKRQAEQLVKQGSVRGMRQEQFAGLVTELRERQDSAMRELIRSFGDEAITATEYGAEAANLFSDVKVKIYEADGGQLLVTSNAKNLTLYLNERVVPGFAGTMISKLRPGEYRVLMQAPNRDVREYRINVEPNTLARLDIQTVADAALVTGKWVGFLHTTKEVEGATAAALVKMQPQHTEVVTLRILPQVRSIVVVATKYQTATGQLLLRGSITLDRDALRSKNNADRLRQLVIFLRWNGDDSSKAVTIEKGKKVEIPTKPSIEEPVAPMPAPPPAETASYAAKPSGRQLVPRPSHVGAKVLVVGGVVTMIGGGVLLAIDEDPNNGSGKVEPTYRESTMAGIVTLSAGTVIAGLGLWLWLRNDAAPVRTLSATSRSTPIVAVSHDQLVLGWSGGF